MNSDIQSTKLPDRRQDKTALERHFQTFLVSVAVAAATASVALMLSLDKSFAVFSQRMENAGHRLQSLETKIDDLGDVKIRIQHLEQDMERYHK